VLATLLLVNLRAANLPISPPQHDQSQYLAYAYNMVKRGKFSAGWARSTKPDQRREPGYPMLLATGMLLHPGLDIGSTNTRCVAEGAPDCLHAVTGLKAINLLFLALSGLAVFAAILAVTRSAVLAWLGFGWVMLSATYGNHVGRFFPEIVVGFLIVALSLRLWRLATISPEHRAWFLTGLLLGAVVMIKATFYYLVPLLAVTLVGHAVLRQAVPRREAAILGLIFLAGVLVLTVPWHLRNTISTGTSALAGRAGLVLLVRANYDDLSVPEMLAAAAVFSPYHTPPRRFFTERWLTPELEASLNGPNDPRARGYKRQGELQALTGYSAYDSELDDLLKLEALGRIKANFLGHLRATLLFGYRGFFADTGLGFPPVRLSGEGAAPSVGTYLAGIDPGGWFVYRPILPNLLLFLPTFAAFAFCIVTRRWPLIFLMLPAAYLYGLQAFMTYYIPRYSVALIPMLVVIAMLAVSPIWNRLSVWTSR
jgi:hypothetical protein